MFYLPFGLRSLQVLTHPTIPLQVNMTLCQQKRVISTSQMWQGRANYFYIICTTLLSFLDIYFIHLYYKIAYKTTEAAQPVHSGPVVQQCDQMFNPGPCWLVHSNFHLPIAVKRDDESRDGVPAPNHYQVGVLAFGCASEWMWFCEVLSHPKLWARLGTLCGILTNSLAQLYSIFYHIMDMILKWIPYYIPSLTGWQNDWKSCLSKQRCSLCSIQIKVRHEAFSISVLFHCGLESVVKRAL